MARDEDGVELQRLWSDPAVRGGRNPAPRPNRQDRRKQLATVARKRVRPMGGYRKTTGCWIGKIGLDELDDWPDADKIEVGFELHKAWWGRAASRRSLAE
ncbi:MAG: GNAT family N-acetyltransferase [Candidatus Rokuibacteriota bacterium]